MGLGGAAGPTGPAARFDQPAARWLLLASCTSFLPSTLTPNRAPSRRLARPVSFARLDGARLAGLRSGQQFGWHSRHGGRPAGDLKKRRRAARDAGGDPGSTARVWAICSPSRCVARRQAARQRRCRHQIGYWLHSAAGTPPRAGRASSGSSPTSSSCKAPGWVYGRGWHVLFDTRGG